jgi:hypothetical protein
MDFVTRLSPIDQTLFKALKTPVEIQAYLDAIPYNGEERNRCPQQVIDDQQCHCLDGGMLGALALRCIGFPPLLIDLVPEPYTDDDHVLAVFKTRGLYGAVAKSNFSALRYREPVYRSLRELVMSYFEVFFNVDGMKTLRGYTRPFNLSAYDRYEWPISETGAARVFERFYALKPIPVMPPEVIPTLSKLDSRSYRTNMLEVNMNGLYQGPSPKHN